VPESVDVHRGVMGFVTHRQAPSVPALGEFVVERGDLEVSAVIEVVLLVRLACDQEDDFLGRAVVQRAQAHRARMGHHVDGAVDQVLGTQLHARLSDGEDFRVGGRVVRLGHLVRTLGENLAIFDDHRCEWTTALGDVLAGQVDRSLGKVGHSSEGSPERSGNRPCGIN
jgi:hypothetical protein